MKTLSKILVLILITVSLISCQKKEHYRVSNVSTRIVKMDYDCSLSDDKFHKPQLCNAILFETLYSYKGMHFYVELNTCTLPRYIYIDTKWLYNHKKGDIIHFDYLLKSRFFTIKDTSQF